jgi:histidyl-tRNA synthetase
VDALTALLGDPAVARGQLHDAVTALSIDPESPAARGLQTVLRAVAAASGGRCALVFDPTLVRGMSYYTGQIFEIAHKNSPSSIAGGGRYDRMIGRLLGRDVPACGFSIGFERIVAILQERAASPGSAPRLALIANAERDDVGEVVAAAQRLRAQGYLVSIESRGRRLRKQLDDLAAHGVGSYLIVGEPEIRSIDSLVDAS